MEIKLPKFLPKIVFVLPNLSFNKNNFNIKKIVLGIAALSAVGYLVYQLNESYITTQEIIRIASTDQPAEQLPKQLHDEKPVSQHDESIFDPSMQITGPDKSIAELLPQKVRELALESHMIFQESYNKAISAYNNNRVDEAINEFENVIKHGSSNDEYFFTSVILLADLYARKKEFQPAIRNYNLAIKLSENQPKLHFALAQVFERAEQFQYAIKEYETAINIDKKYIDAYTALFNLYMSLRNNSEAKKIAQLGYNNNNNNPEMLYNLALIYIKEFNYKQALDRLKEAWKFAQNTNQESIKIKILLQLAKIYDTESEKNYDKIIEYLSIAANQVDANNITVLENLALAYSNIKQFNKAINVYDRLIRIEPENYKHYLLAGSFLLELNKLDEALNYFNRAEQINPDNYFLHYSLGTIFLEKGYKGHAYNYLSKAIETGQKVKIPETYEDINTILFNSYIRIAPLLIENNYSDQATQIYKNALKLQERHFIYYNLGIIYEQKKDYTQAEQYYLAAIERNYENFDYNKALGSLLFKLNRYSNSSRFINNAYNINPNDFEITFMKAYNHYIDGQINEALINFKKVLLQNPSKNILAMTHKNIGNIYNIKNNASEAIMHYLKSINLNPEDGILYYNTALAYIKANNTNAAINFLKTAESLMPENPQVLAALGNTYFENGLPQLAEEYYTKALEYDPTNIEINYNLKITRDLLSSK